MCLFIFNPFREEYLGVVAPVPRTKEDLDAPSIFHIANDYDMIRYFTRTILQFQVSNVIFMEYLAFSLPAYLPF